MIRRVTIDNILYNISTDPKDFFESNPIVQRKCCVALEMMKDCLDYIHDLMKTTYPNAFKPELYISDTQECNAVAWKGKSIIIFSGLILQQAELIENKYTPEILEKYKIFQNISHENVLAGLRVYFWRYVLLHELYHIWNKHSLWKKLYKFNESGKLVQKVQLPAGIDLTQYYIQLLESTFESEKVVSNANCSNTLETQKKITQQAMELDADSSAICMLINLLMRDIEAGRVSENNKKSYICTEMGFIMAALATAFSLFDGNAGAKFESLMTLENTEHPLPSIRMLYAEEIADGCLNYYFPDMDELRDLQTEWQKVVCDVEADFNGQVDMGQVFYYTAYTEKAQKHLCRLKHRLTDMHDTMKPLVLANFADKLDDEDMEFLPSFVWFTDEGENIKNWINPATGIPYAIRSDRIKKAQQEKVKQQPFVRKNPKIGANDSCPCGSGKKFKKCCHGNGKYD